MFSKTIVACLAFLLFLISGSAEAQKGAGNGAFLGYRIGEKYPVTSSTQLFSCRGEDCQFAYVVLAERQVKPDDFGPVYLLVTKMTYTILTISSSRDFASKQAQMAFYDKYVDILSSLYPTADKVSVDPPFVESTHTIFEFLLARQESKTIWLGVHTTKTWPESRFTGHHPVHIALRFGGRPGFPELYWQAVAESAQRDGLR